MEIEFDAEKNLANIRERGISFESASEFDFETAVIRMDFRRDYSEARFNALGYIGQRIFHMTFTVRMHVIRIISLRKANNREIKRYANT